MAALVYLVFLGLLKVGFSENCSLNIEPDYIKWEKELKEALKCNYHVYIAPKGNETHPVTVDISFVMKYFKFSSDEEIFTATTWMFVSWIDDRLKWDPDQHHGIKAMEISSARIWTPSFLLANSADVFYDFDKYFYVKCKLESNGKILCVPKSVHQARCSVKLKNWPYDEQECSLDFVRWTSSKLDNFTMNYSKRAITMLGADYGAEWFISEYRQEGGKDSGKQLKMIFTLEREAAGLAAIVIYPSLILTTLSITILFMDVRFRTRLAMACYNLLGHYYFLTEIAENLPKESVDPPILLLYYRGSLILSFLILMVTFVLDEICKQKSTPQNYIISVNDRVFESYGKFLVISRWDNFNDVMIKSEHYNEQWLKFANVVNSMFIVIVLIAYIGLYCSFMPQPIPWKL